MVLGGAGVAFCYGGLLIEGVLLVWSSGGGACSKGPALGGWPSVMAFWFGILVHTVES